MPALNLSKKTYDKYHNSSQAYSTYLFCFDFRLGIIHEYTKVYGTHITPSEYLALLNCLQIVLANNSGNLDWDMFKKLVCLVLECSHVQMTDDEDYKNSLLSLWNSCVR